MLTSSQLTQVHAASITLPDPTVTPDETPGIRPQTVVAAPNLSRGGTPIHFLVQLNAPADIKLAVYALTGERVFDERLQGNVGMNQLVWRLENNARQSVASGLYLYRLEMDGGAGLAARTGKLLVVH
ncbi:MAG TPA: hypothetical protein VMU88_07410 [bacterium]|nr:hypothetical protein [bacterium]